MKKTITTFLTSEKSAYVDIGMLLLIPILILTIPIPYVNLLVPVIFVLIYSWLQGGVGKQLGFSKPKSVGKFLLYTLGVTMIFAVYISILMPTVVYFTEVPQDISLFDPMRGNLVNYLVFLAIGWVIGGFVEEILFRAFMMKKIMLLIKNKLLGKIIAATIPAAFFGFLHAYQGITGQIVTGLIGFGLALLYLRNQHNTWQNVCTHGLIDTIIFTMFYMSWDKALGL